MRVHADKKAILRDDGLEEGVIRRYMRLHDQPLIGIGPIRGQRPGDLTGHPLQQFGRGLSGERESQNPFGGDMVAFRQRDDPTRHRRRLSRSGAGDHQNVLVAGRVDHRLLFGRRAEAAFGPGGCVHGIR